MIDPFWRARTRDLYIDSLNRIPFVVIVFFFTIDLRLNSSHVRFVSVSREFRIEMLEIS